MYDVYKHSAHCFARTHIAETEQNNPADFESAKKRIKASNIDRADHLYRTITVEARTKHVMNFC